MTTPSHPVYNTNRYIYNNDMHYSAAFFSEQTVCEIQDYVARKIQVTVAPEQIKNVMDSVYQSNPRVGLQQMAQMCADYIISYIETERDVLQQNSKYDISVQKYDGSFGLQQFAQGQLGIRKKGPNRFQMRMIY
jgi:uncharacterized protein with HEPN domain